MAFMECIPSERLSTNRGIKNPPKKQAHTLCAFLSFHFLQLLKLITLVDTSIFLAIINQQKKNKNSKAICSMHLLTNCGEQDDCVGRRTIVSSCDLAVSEVFGVQAGGSRKV